MVANVTDDFERTMRRVGAGGWDESLEDGETDLREAMSKQAKADAEERAATRRMVRDALGGEAGARLMDWLMRNTVLLPPQGLELDATTAEAYAIAKAKREGQNAVVLQLKRLLDEDDEDSEG